MFTSKSLFSLALLLASAFLALDPSPAAACGGWTDVVCNAGKAAEKAGQDVGKTVEKAGQDVGKTVEKAGQDVGKTVEKAGQDVGKTVEKATQDTGHTLEKAAHDTGHTLEKAGQDVGHFLKQVADFDLSCKLPGAKPDQIAVSYQDTCGGKFSTYKNDVDVCNQAGGVSLLAAATAGAALNPTPAGAATYVLAKVAFEMCEKACTSQRTMNSCIADVDKLALQAANDANQKTASNDEELARLDLSSCVDDAYAAEKLTIIDKVLAECTANSSCNTDDPSYAAKLKQDVQPKLDALEAERIPAVEGVKNGTNVGDAKYGPRLVTDRIKAISITSSAQDLTRLCRVKSSSATLRFLPTDAAFKPTSVRWINAVGATSETPANIDPNNGTFSSVLELENQPQGVWKAMVLDTSGNSVAEYGFLFRPENE